MLRRGQPDFGGQRRSRHTDGVDVWPGLVRDQPGTVIVGGAVQVTGTMPEFGSSLPAVAGPITIGGTSEITGFGNATWITVEDITNPANPTWVAGFNPANPIPTPGLSNSTNALGVFAIPFNPETFYATNGIKTIEIFATDNAGSVGNVVKFTFDLNPATQLVFATPGEPPATALAGQNFAASPNTVIVDALDFLGGLATTYEGPVTISLANGALGTFDPTSTLTETAVNGVATFPSLAIDTAGTYVLQAANTGLTPGDSTAITIAPNTPTQLIWVTQPGTKQTEGVPFSAKLDLEDQYGNLETTQQVALSLSFNGNPDNGDLGGTDTVAAAGGVVTFSNIIINNIGTPYTVTASFGSV